MAITRRTPTITSTSLGLPQDPMAVNLDVCVPANTGVSTNPTDVANPTNPDSPTNPTNLTNTTGLVNPANLADPNDRPLSPRVDLSLAPHTEGFINVE
uniref:Uncharacterized protein n=1 Tax=Cannabis sativa TaxID=3483 RepID=A0A803QK56_CANSA